MGLSRQTEVNYLSNLRKLKRAYPYLNDVDKERCMKQMMKIADKLGLELDGPTLQERLARGPGRPSDNFTVPGYAEEQIRKHEEEERVERERNPWAEDQTERARRLAKGSSIPAPTTEEMQAMNARAQKTKKADELTDELKRIEEADKKRKHAAALIAEADRDERRAKQNLEAALAKPETAPVFVMPKETLEQLVEENLSMDELIKRANDEFVEEKEEKPPEDPTQAG